MNNLCEKPVLFNNIIVRNTGLKRIFCYNDYKIVERLDGIHSIK